MWWVQYPLDFLGRAGRNAHTRGKPRVLITVCMRFSCKKTRLSRVVCISPSLIQPDGVSRADGEGRGLEGYLTCAWFFGWFMIKSATARGSLLSCGEV